MKTPNSNARWRRSAVPRRRRHAVSCCLAGLLWLLSMATGTRAQAIEDPAVDHPKPMPEQPLEAEESLRRSIQIGETQTYSLALTPGLWHLTTAQHGVQIFNELVDPAGQATSFESPLQYHGVDQHLLEVTAAGAWRWSIRALNGDGEYTVRYRRLADHGLGDLEPTSPLARLHAFSQVGVFNALGTSEARRRALEALRPLLGSATDPADDVATAEVLDHLGTLERQLGEQEEAASHHLRALTIWRAEGDLARQARSSNGLGLALWNQGQSNEARAYFQESLELRRSLGDDAAVARTLNNVCLTYHSQGLLPKAGDCYREVIQLFEALGDHPSNEGLSRLNLGNISQTSAEPDEALDNYLDALQLFRQAGDANGEARALNHLGVLTRMTGDVSDALQHYFEALEIDRRLGNRRSEGRVLSNIGFAYYSLGDFERALGFFSQALPLRRESQDRRGEAVTLGHLGNVHRRSGELRAALDYHRQALLIYQDLGNRRGEATALLHLAESQIAAQRHPDALASLATALKLLKDVGAQDTEAQVHLLRAELLLEKGQIQEASGDIERALELSVALRHAAGEITALVLRARAHRLQDKPLSALQQADVAIQRIEALRTRVLHPDLRALYLASVRQAYELRIDLEMELHAVHPEAGHDVRALEISERAHARSLLDLVREGRGFGLPGSGRSPASGIDTDLNSRYVAAQRRLDAKANRQLRLLRGDHDAAEARRLELEINGAISELESLEAQLRRRHDDSLVIVRPAALDSHAMRELLDDGTVMLEYALGERRSFVWRIERGGIEVYELPPRSELEARVRAVQTSLSRPAGGSYQDDQRALRELSQVLLQPLAPWLLDPPSHDAAEDGATAAPSSAAPHRLIIVPDGALGLLPFAALQRPRADALQPEPSWEVTEPLVESLEISYLPSASVLVALRRAAPGRPEPTHQVAILADPVFDRRDPRSPPPDAPLSTPADGTTTDGTKTDGTPADSVDGSAVDAAEERPTAAPIPFERLPASRREAEAIMAVATPEKAWLAMGFEAHREAVFDPRLADFRIVHFATHGWIDDRNPALSGLVLSQLKADGTPRPGLLRLHDIGRLPLNADLVVLSGCQTAIGREVRGEGMIGLGRGFMSAGAQRVAASLWRVQDRATAELMAHFYDRLLRQGASPAAALRDAQRHIRKQRRWRHPYYWAAFLVQGDWRIKSPTTPEIE